MADATPPAHADPSCAEDLRGTRCLITGAGGFLGRHLAGALGELGAEVHGTLRPGSPAAGRHAARLHAVDLEHADGLGKLWRELRPQIVVHAAVYGVHPDRRHGETMVRTNVLGTYAVLECARRFDVERLLLVGGSSEYGDKSEPMKESDLPEPSSLYGATKAAATLLGQQAARRHHLPALILRPFSIYGPGEPAHRLIPRAIRAALEGWPIPLTGPGWQRDFIFVDDVVEAFVRACRLEAGAFRRMRGEIVNIGSGRQTSNEEVVRLIDQLTGGRLETLPGTYPPHATDARHWVADISKARRALGWRPRTPLREGLARTVDAARHGEP